MVRLKEGWYSVFCIQASQHGTLYKGAAVAGGKYGSSTRGWLQGDTCEAVQLVMGDLQGQSGQEFSSRVRPGFNS